MFSDIVNVCSVDMTVEMVGSCCTLVAEKLLQDKGFTFDEKLASLLYGEFTVVLKRKSIIVKSRTWVSCSFDILKSAKFFVFLFSECMHFCFSAVYRIVSTRNLLCLILTDNLLISQSQKVLNIRVCNNFHIM